MLICTKHCIGKSETSIPIQIIPGERIRVVKKVRNATKILVFGKGIVYLDKDVLIKNFKELNNENEEKKKAQNNSKKLDS